MTVTRVPDWEAALVRYANEQTGRPFAYGETDCGSLVVGALAVMYTEPPLPSPRYGDLRQALHIVAGLEDGVVGVMAHAGARTLTARYAQAGDVVVWPDKRARVPCLGVVVSADQVLASDEKAGPHIMDASDEGLADAILWRLPWVL